MWNRLRRSQPVISSWAAEQSWSWTITILHLNLILNELLQFSWFIFCFLKHLRSLHRLEVKPALMPCTHLLKEGEEEEQLRLKMQQSREEKQQQQKHAASVPATTSTTSTVWVTPTPSCLSTTTTTSILIHPGAAEPRLQLSDWHTDPLQPARKTS